MEKLYAKWRTNIKKAIKVPPVISYHNHELIACCCDCNLKFLDVLEIKVPTHLYYFVCTANILIIKITGFALVPFLLSFWLQVTKKPEKLIFPTRNEITLKA